MKYKNLLLLLLCLCCVGNISAQQWSFDAYGGINLCYPTMKHSYGTQYQELVKLSWPWDISRTNRFNGGVSAHYYFNKWWGVRADINYQLRTYGGHIKCHYVLCVTQNFGSSSIIRHIHYYNRPSCHIINGF